MTVTGEVRPTSDHDGAGSSRAVSGELRDEQVRFHSAIEGFIAEPSTAAFEELLAAGGTYLGFEARVLLPVAVRVGVDPELIDAARAAHDEIALAFNAVLWTAPGSMRQREGAVRLQRVLLEQIDACEACLLPALVAP